MPKLKTHKGAKARFHVTGNGKVVRRKRHISHLRRKKTAKVKRLFHKKLEISAADKGRVLKLLPYIGKGS
jgi:large subunit ribosomal protein L35